MNIENENNATKIKKKDKSKSRHKSRKNKKSKKDLVTDADSRLRRLSMEETNIDELNNDVDQLNSDVDNANNNSVPIYDNVGFVPEYISNPETFVKVDIHENGDMEMNKKTADSTHEKHSRILGTFRQTDV